MDIKRRCCNVSDFPVADIHVTQIDTSKWIPPPYKEAYRNKRFVWDKPLLVINNKYSMEWDCAPVNFISLETLDKIFSLLKDKFQIVYNRAVSEDIICDDQPILDFGDYELIKNSFPEVITFHSLKKMNKDLTFNTLQLMVYANCDRFISVQGGGATLASYFGGTNIIFIKQGVELKANSYLNWYNKFSNCKVIQTDNYNGLINEITKNYSS